MKQYENRKGYFARNNKKEAKEPEKLTLKKEFYTLVHDLVYILAFITVFFVFVIRLVGVSGPSMTPTLLNTDKVALLSNFLYRDIEVNDIVVAQVPSFDEEAIVKRVIATEGQSVDIRYDENGVGTVFVDGVALEEMYINEEMHIPSYQTISFPVTVPEGHVFLMGDNRNHSADSRYFMIGLVDERCIIGKVVFLLIPGQESSGERDFSRIGVVS